MSVEIALVAAECKSSIKDEMSLRDRLVAAFGRAKNHWMVLDKDKQMQGAVAAVLNSYPEEHADRQRLMTELEVMGKFNAFLMAAQSGLTVTPPELPDGFEAIGLRKLWADAQK